MTVRVSAILCFIFINLTAIKIYAQSDTSKVDSTYIKAIENMLIERIILVGNDKTEDEVIMRELQIKEGNKLNLRILEEDVKRLYNLNLFNKIDVVPAPLSITRINLIFEFEEMIYLLPLPQGGIKEGSFKKIWGGINFLWRNYNGKNHTLGLSFGIGYEPFIRASYTNPWVFENEHYFYNFSFGYARTYSRIASGRDTTVSIFNKDDYPLFSLNNYSGDFKFGKYMTKDLSLFAGLGINSVTTSEYQPGRTYSTDGKDFFISASLNFSYDTRDYIKFAEYGSYYNISYEKLGIFNEGINLNKFRFDLRRFIPIKLGNDYAVVMALRGLGALTFGGGDLPVYLRETFGYSNFIRGWDTYVFEGEDKFLGSMEWRIPVIKTFYTKGKDHILIKNIPYMNKFTYRYGMFITAFYDFGGVWTRSSRIYDVPFKSGFGIGLNFLLPFEFVGRTDIAFRKINNIYKGQIIFALDASF